ncbi:hypothetical protein ABQE91_10835 [Xanthomonas campestris pv. campestris]|uniref:hypothetical protein n=1 Tax=Xanthomonas campestris TaxID=339 RepID=UPI0032E4D33F
MSITSELMDPEVRAEQIELRAAEARKAGRVRTEYKFRNGVDLPLISLSIHTPIYRLENYRTRDKQLSLAAKGQVPVDFFNPNRREDGSVQLRQHQILVEQARTGSGETIKPIYDELKRVRQQTDELIISADGVVVNGNRRLAAMRELLREDLDTFGSFSHVNCLVLPASANTEEIRSLEIALQMQPETKLPYEWTALGRAVRDLREAGHSDEQITREMNRSRSEILRAVKMVDAAELYLDSWLAKPQNFDELDGTEQAFIQIATRNYGKQDNIAQREVTRQFDFFLVEHRQALTESAYALINTIETNPDAFLNAVAAEFGVTLAPATPTSGSQPKICFDDEPNVAALDYQPLVDALVAVRGDTEKAEATVRAIEDICDVVSEQGKNRDKAALKFASKAEKNLGLVDINTAAPSTYAEIGVVLERCIERIERLRQELQQRTDAGK